MKVFISWSGDDSRKIATELFEWLPMIMQSVQAYMSAESIEKGTRWATSISSELEGTHVGIIVLTPSNIKAPWINFEAGALAKTVADTRLAPVLFGLKPSDVGTPLSQFQVTQFLKDDILKLLKSINACGTEEALPEGRLEKMLDKWWDDIYGKIQPIVDTFGKSVALPKKEENETSKILEEILVLARQQAASMHSPEKLMSPSFVRMVSEIISEQAIPERERRHLRSISRSLYRRWKDVSDFSEMKTSADGIDPEADDRRRSLEAFERNLRDLVDFIENPRPPSGRYSIREAEMIRMGVARAPDRSTTNLSKDKDPEVE